VLLVHVRVVHLNHRQFNQMTANNERLRDISTSTMMRSLRVFGDAESILIFGPGEAKGELKKRLKKDNLDGRIVGMETVDRMTDHQVAAKVRQHFAE